MGHRDSTNARTWGKGASKLPHFKAENSKSPFSSTLHKPCFCFKSSILRKERKKGERKRQQRQRQRKKRKMEGSTEGRKDGERGRKAKEKKEASSNILKS